MDRDRSAYYREVEPLFSQGRIDVLDHPALIRELRMLERRPRAGGADRVDHPRGGKDDHANALAIAATHAALARVTRVSLKRARQSAEAMAGLRRTSPWDLGGPHWRAWEHQ